MFGDAESRLDDVAQGAQGLVDQEAFESIYGKDGYNAKNISTFRNLQRFKAQRQIGATYGEANFQDWSRNFEADVTTELFAIGQRMQGLLRQQGALRTEDIDTFNASIQQGYMDGIKQIDAAVTQLQSNGQYVSQEQINQAKSNLETLRDDMLAMSEGTDFGTRIKNMNEAMEALLTNRMMIEVGPVANIFAGAGGGGAKGAADLATLKQLAQNATGVEAASQFPSHDRGQGR